PFGFLGSFTDDRSVWACTPEGGKLLNTPSYAVTASTQKRRAELQLVGDGSVSGHMQTVFSGGQYDNHLEIAESSGGEQVKMLKATYDIDHISFGDIAYRKPDGQEPTLVEALEVTLPRYAPTNGGQTFLVPNLFNRQSTVPTVKNRQRPVYINRGYTDVDHLTFALPAGYVVVGGSWKAELDSPFGRYEAHLEQTGDQLSYRRQLVLRGGTYPADQYAEFSDFINRVSTLDRHKVVLADK